MYPKYSITYELNGGKNSSDKPKNYTELTQTITLKPATKADHIFFGWYKNSNFSGDKIEKIEQGSTNTIALYAKFIEMKMIDISAVTNGTVGVAGKSNNGEHTVSLTAYRIGETEVTQDLWLAVMGDNPSSFQGSDKNPANGEVQEKRPVEQVCWYDCIAFCNELTKLVTELGAEQCVYYSDEDCTKVYIKDDAQNSKVPYIKWDKKGFRLPTEAEWEWAAQGGSSRHKYAGTGAESQLGQYAWYTDNSGKKMHEVKKNLANGYGLYDMSGNVWEWCWDWYSNSTPTDRQYPAGDVYRVWRGGS